MVCRYSSKYSPVCDWSKRDRKVNRRGYVLVKVPEHPSASKGGWVYEHRLVIEVLIGRILKHYETVHHINEQKQDNRWENLFLCYRQEHDKAHALAFT